MTTPKDITKAVVSANPKVTDHFVKLDGLDEKQIEAEMQGHLIEDLFYAFHEGNKLVVGASKLLIDEMADAIGIEPVPNLCTVILMEGEYVATAWSKDKQGGMRQGVASCKKSEKFAATKAASKAMRNSRRAFLPITKIMTKVSMALKTQRPDLMEKLLKQNKPVKLPPAPKAKTNVTAPADRKVPPDQKIEAARLRKEVFRLAIKKKLQTTNEWKADLEKMEADQLRDLKDKISRM